MADQRSVKLGKLVSNLQSLECLLRVYLLGIAQKGASATSGPDYWSLKVGVIIGLDEFTNYDSLGTLIEKYNADVGSRDPSLTIDSDIVEIRDP